MDDDPPTEDTPPWRSAVVDVTGMSLAQLAGITPDDDSPLAYALRRLTADLEHPGDPIAGFNSAL